ncbi:MULTISPECIES: gamma carbonic anhydrase family protein [unclassified Oceanispirochaeta]|uniref:gamma carbonic anhydrase family protein n=1 Tax=unclassified Oceanispirochaeta TaxID=2635722 RepID=UPI000E098251|nr:MULTISPECIES: gamma carbonic anhydrase family protein [unclassified Oceanispirochaeta]MBF9018500.1 gamma carbonic anhydrase family protein [Oceanispirochaeta sp. M2]NPD74907.1 gamma carbonic anhydrase family protein [Oceanispirochaeta sp. M1]RDG29239.1 gamma carbonic anhydrase family protein [Oceanispirochaeta sp. M1]
MNYSLKGKAPVIDKNVGFIAASADLVGDITIAEGVSIWFNAVIRADMDSISIGKNTNIQDCSVVHTDYGFPTTLGEGVTVGHGAVIHGCTIGDNCLIGMGAVVLNGVEVGEDSLVGAGSLISQGMKIPPRSLVLGSPAKVVKELKPGMIEAIRKNGAAYVSNGADYLEELAVLCEEPE